MAWVVRISTVRFMWAMFWTSVRLEDRSRFRRGMPLSFWPVPELAPHLYSRCCIHWQRLAPAAKFGGSMELGMGINIRLQQSRANYLGGWCAVRSISLTASPTLTIDWDGTTTPLAT